MSNTLCRTYIRAYRLANGLKQHEMADNLAARVATYKSWEYGVNRPSTHRQRMILEHFFKKSLPEILGPAMIVSLEGEEGGFEIRCLV